MLTPRVRNSVMTWRRVRMRANEGGATMRRSDGGPAVTERWPAGATERDHDERRLINKPCLECRYFARETLAAKAAIAQLKGAELYGRPLDHIYGECRRRSPVVLESSTSHCRWPIVYADDWCGEWVSPFA